MALCIYVDHWIFSSHSSQLRIWVSCKYMLQIMMSRHLPRGPHVHAIVKVLPVRDHACVNVLSYFRDQVDKTIRCMYITESQRFGKRNSAPTLTWMIYPYGRYNFVELQLCSEATQHIFIGSVTCWLQQNLQNAYIKIRWDETNKVDQKEKKTPINYEPKKWNDKKS
jgi:hypothetical protein